MQATDTSSARRRHLPREVFSIAWQDLRHDARNTFVFVCTVAAIAAPLLLLLGLKNGVITSLRETLLQDPRNLEVIIYGNSCLSRDWLRQIGRDPRTRFLVPKTRTINASVDLVDDSKNFLLALEVVPTTAGDPLLPVNVELPDWPDHVLITESLAKKLSANGSKSIEAIIKRNRDGTREHRRIPLNVVGVIPESRYARDALFTTLDFLVSIEDYRDGHDLSIGPEGPAPGYAETRTRFANGRLYARRLEDVAPLAQRLRNEGIEVRTSAEDIAAVQAFDRMLSFIYRVVAIVSGIGGGLALGGAIWSSVERKRRQLALLRLFGFSHTAVAAIPMIQGVSIAAAGFLLAIATYLVGAESFASVLDQSIDGGPFVSVLSARDMLSAGTAVLAIAFVTSGAAALYAGRLTPAEGLRDATC